MTNVYTFNLTNYVIHICSIANRKVPAQRPALRVSDISGDSASSVPGRPTVRRGRAVVPLGRHLRRTKRLQYSKSNSSVIVSTVAYAEFLLSNYGTL